MSNANENTAVEEDSLRIRISQSSLGGRDARIFQKVPNRLAQLVKTGVSSTWVLSKIALFRQLSHAAFELMKNRDALQDV
jgi:hypothetical protein